MKTQERGEENTLDGLFIYQPCLYLPTCLTKLILLYSLIDLWSLDRVWDRSSFVGNDIYIYIFEKGSYPSTFTPSDGPTTPIWYTSGHSSESESNPPINKWRDEIIVVGQSVEQSRNKHDKVFRSFLNGWMCSSMMHWRLTECQMYTVHGSLRCLSLLLFLFKWYDIYDLGVDIAISPGNSALSLPEEEMGWIFTCFFPFFLDRIQINDAFYKQIKYQRY